MSNSDLAEHFAVLAEDHVIQTASPQTRRPRYRLPAHRHVPMLERDARKALPPDAVRCLCCGERVASEPSAERPCQECGSRG